MTEQVAEQTLLMPTGSADERAQATVRNPYVGPRTFTLADRNWYFGREQEAQNLLALVIAERLTLFYAQSGAGKSSLLNTQLIPALREQARYLVLPVGRVGGELPAGIADVANIYTFNLLLSLDQNKASAPDRFATMALVDFMAGLRTRDGQHYSYDEATAQRARASRSNGQAPPRNQPPHVLIIDQFEELVTTHPQRWRERETFFQQLGEAMRADPLLWVVLTLREDFIAPLDPFAHLVPGNLTNRFYMQRMGLDAALLAIQRPAEKAGRPFAPRVAEMLVDNLCQVRMAGQEGTFPGQYVEPVQLQVVCYQLWEKVIMTGKPTGVITMTDLQQSGDVNTALGDFYNQALVATLAGSALPISEQRLRAWFDNELITEAGTRGTVYQGLADTAGLPNMLVKLLADQFLLRIEQRAGSFWVELVHDRLVEPIQRSNRAWSNAHQHPLTRAAQSWRDAQKDGNLLLIGAQLQSAQAQLAAAPSEFGDLEQEFVKASLAATQRQRQRRQRLFMGAVLLMVFVLISLATWALSNANYAQEQQTKANNERSTAVAALTAQSKIVQTSIARVEIAEGTRVQTVNLNSKLAGNLAILLTAQARVTNSTSTPPKFLPVAPSGTPSVTWNSVDWNTTVSWNSVSWNSVSWGNDSESVTVTASVTPTYPLPTANLFATATFAAIQHELIQLQATQTAIARTAATSTIQIGQVLQTTDWVNVRRAPGYVGKPTDDVIGQIAPETSVVIVAGPANVDSILWWQIQGVDGSSVAITGWVATSINGRALLAATSFSNLSLAKPFTGDYPITQYFGENPELYSRITYDGVPLKGNNRLDFGLPTGTPVLATDSGRVKRVDYESGGFGNFIILEHEWGESIYTQLSEAGVTEGQVVERGEQIGLSGVSGAANGSFLGFGIRLNPYSRTDGWGGFSDPLPYLHLANE